MFFSPLEPPVVQNPLHSHTRAAVTLDEVVQEWCLELTWKSEIRLKSPLLQAVLPAALSPSDYVGNGRWLHTGIWDPGHQTPQMSQSSGNIYEANAKKWAQRQTETNLEHAWADCWLEIEAESIWVTESESLSPCHRKLCTQLYSSSIHLSQALQYLVLGIPWATVWHCKFVVLLLKILFTSL